MSFSQFIKIIIIIIIRSTKREYIFLNIKTGVTNEWHHLLTFTILYKIKLIMYYI